MDSVSTGLLGRFSSNHLVATVNVLLSYLQLSRQNKTCTFKYVVGVGWSELWAKILSFKVIGKQMWGSLCELDVF